MCPFQWLCGGKGCAVEEPSRCVGEKGRNSKQEKRKVEERNSSFSCRELKSNNHLTQGAGGAHRDDSARFSVKIFQILIKYSLVLRHPLIAQ